MASLTGDNVTLVSTEGDKFEVPKNIAKQSKLVESMVDDDDDDDDDHEIPIVNVKNKVLVKVIAFMKHYDKEEMKEIEKPLTKNNIEELVQPFYADYVNVDQDALFELIMAANYMNVPPLLDLTCAKVASQIKGKSPEEIRATFNIVNDFTPEEEAQIREENNWTVDV
jgi:S-phase kinase-associated protein 1